jgi:hypothetical protein
MIKSRRMRWAGNVARVGNTNTTVNNNNKKKKMNAYRIFVGKLEGKRPLGRPRHRWMDNI